LDWEPEDLDWETEDDEDESSEESDDEVWKDDNDTEGAIDTEGDNSILDGHADDFGLDDDALSLGNGIRGDA
jgi:hypothetical protein